MADFVLETEEMITGAGHRPAKLFKRNMDAFYQSVIRIQGNTIRIPL